MIKAAINASMNQSDGITETVFVAMDNFHMEQLRLENLWLRQRLLRAQNQILDLPHTHKALDRATGKPACGCELCRRLVA